ncbi:MAG TPA: O-antigen ligase family protein [Bryobacteraceae bacterium]|nr:O-antigen ligase family protein [Bryobacteraceae bacterium]
MIAFALLLLLVFTMPWEKSVVLPGLGTLTRVLGVAAAVASLPHLKRLRPNIVLIPATAYVLWSAATFLWSLDRTATTIRAVTLVQLLLMFCIALVLCDTPERTRLVLCAWVAGCAVASAATISRYVQGAETYYRRFAAPGFDPNDLALTVALGVPVAVYLGGRWFAALPVVLAAVLLTASRTGLIAAGLGFLPLLINWRHTSLVDRALGAAMLVLLLAGASVLAPEPARKRIATTVTEVTRGTLHKRTTIWKTGLRALRQWPLGGAGAGAYPEAVRPYIGVPPRSGHVYVAHNVFVSVLVETGVVGFGLFALGLIGVALLVWVLPARQRGLWVAVLSVWLCAAATLTWEHRKPTWLFPALVASMWSRSFRGGEERPA